MDNKEKGEFRDLLLKNFSKFLEERSKNINSQFEGFKNPEDIEDMKRLQELMNNMKISAKVVEGSGMDVGMGILLAKALRRIMIVVLRENDRGIKIPNMCHGLFYTKLPDTEYQIQISVVSTKKLQIKEGEIIGYDGTTMSTSKN